MKRCSHILAAYFFAGVAVAEKLPRSITHEVLPSGEHRYSIEDVYVKCPREAIRMTEYYQKKIPGCTSLTIDTTNRTMVFVTDTAVTNLPQHCDNFARGGGMMPYWGELETRDRRSASFDPDLYSLVLSTNIAWSGDTGGPGLLAVTNSPDGLLLTFYSRTVHAGHRSFLVDFHLTPSNGGFALGRAGDKHWVDWSEIGPRSRPFWLASQSVPMTYAPRRSGRVTLNKTTAFCMCHSRFAVRIFDANDEFVWEDQEHAYGTPYLAAGDVNRNGIDEIILYESEHGFTHFFVFERKKTENFQQDESTVSAGTRGRAPAVP